MVAEIDFELSVVVWIGPDSDGLPSKGFADFQDLSAIVDLALLLHASDYLTRPVFDRWKLLGEGAYGRLVARDRRLHIDGLVRSLKVVALPPGVEVALGVEQIIETLTGQKFELQGAMEALVLAECLRMIRPRVRDFDAELNEPYTEQGEGTIERISPGRAVVGRDTVRESVAAEGVGKCAFHGVALLIGAGAQTEIESGVVIEDGQGVAALAVVHGDMPFEIHLQERVGSGVLETLKGWMSVGAGRVDAPVSKHNGVDGTGRRPVCDVGIESLTALE